MNKLTLTQFNEICNDFIDTKVNTIDYIGFIHTLIYTMVSNNVADDNDIDDIYTSIVDFY